MNGASASNGSSPPAPDTARPAYLICATPRSGATLLCELLIRTRLAGRPDEFFCTGNEPDWAEDDYARYVRRLYRTTPTANGVFGAKLMWRNLDRFVGKVRESTPDLVDAPDAQLLEELLPNLHWIFVSRRDVRAQAASWLQADRSGDWSEQPRERLPMSRLLRLDGYGIADRVSRVESGNDGWRSWFDAQSVVPYEVTYEELSSEPERVVRNLFDELGVEAERLPDLRLGSAKRFPPEQPVGLQMPAPRSRALLKHKLRRQPRVRAAKTLFICGMPRSGTTYLGELLRSTGLVGHPREYFRQLKEPEWAQDHYDVFVSSTVAATTVNDIFGAKFVGDQLLRLLHQLREMRGSAELSDRALLERTFPDLRLVWLRREDALAQAVSWWKAEQTGVWWTDGGPAPHERPGAKFDFQEIQNRLEWIARGNERWEEWFRTTGFEPLRITYAELDADPIGTTGRVLDFLSLEPPPGIAPTAWAVRQADAVNDEWIARYRTIAAKGQP